MLSLGFGKMFKPSVLHRSPAFGGTRQDHLLETQRWNMREIKALAISDSKNCFMPLFVFLKFFSPLSNKLFSWLMGKNMALILINE